MDCKIILSDESINPIFEEIKGSATGSHHSFKHNTKKGRVVVPHPKKDYYIYPAIFNYEDKEIAISFPDLPGCYSCGKNDEEALYMAKDALGLYIVSAEEGRSKYAII